MKKIRIRPAIADCLVLFCINLVSSLPYEFRLGFYSDDWLYQSALSGSSSHGIGAMFRALLKVDTDLFLRPGQLAYLVFGFRLFGRHPMPYHILNSVALATVTVLLYIVLNELPAGRWLAFVVALVFGLLPQYSTDRFWIASHQATLSMAFALLGIYAMLRSVRPEGRSSKAWVALASLGLVLSVLFYEVALGLILGSFAVIGVREYMRARTTSQGRFRNAGRFAIPAIVLVAVGILKAGRQTRVHFQGHFLEHLGAWVDKGWNAGVQALRFNLWTYGVKMPTVLASMYRNAALSWVAICCASVITLIVTAYLWSQMENSIIPGRRTCIWLIFTGFVLFGLGYGLFFYNGLVDFSSPGDDNRVAIASALGVPFVIAGIVGLATSLLLSRMIRIRVCAVAIGLICGVNCLAVDGIGSFWAGAAARQSALLRTVADNVPSLPNGSVLLLDGFCRYFGPAIVFETDWDTSGAIQILTGDYSLKGDVVSPNLRLHDTNIETILYGWPEGSYSYTDHLFVFNVQRRTLTRWPSKEAATTYLRAVNPNQDSGCPAGREGRGTKVF